MIVTEERIGCPHCSMGGVKIQVDKLDDGRTRVHGMRQTHSCDSCGKRFRLKPTVVGVPLDHDRILKGVSLNGR